MTRPDSAQFRADDFFVLRSPMLPLGEILRRMEPLRAAAAWRAGEDLQEALAHDGAVLRDLLSDLLQLHLFREAMWIASPDLVAALNTLPRDGTTELPPPWAAAFRYVLRAAARPTPFGLFAGLTLGTIGKATALRIAPSDAWWRRSQLDYDLLCAIASAAVTGAVAAGAIRWKPNDSLYLLHGSIRYVETRIEPSGRSHRLVEVSSTPYIEHVLEAATKGASTSQIAASLVAFDRELSLEEAREFVLQLAGEGMLEPETAPLVTGEDIAGDLISKLRHAGASRLAETLSEVRAALDESPADARVTVAVRAMLPERNVAFPLHAELVKPPETVVLGTSVIREIARGVHALHALFGGRGAPDLDRFRTAFERRYGDREVPLVEALDGEAGIGFETDADPTPLLDGFPQTPEKEHAHGGSAKPLLVARLAEAIRAGAADIELHPAELEAAAPRSCAPLPDAFSVLARVAGAPNAEVDRVMLTILAGPSGATLLGRFCHAYPALRRAVEQHLSREEALDPDAVFAEIVHVPQGRHGNVISRPVLRAHELPFLGKSGAPGERQIAVSDLLVSVDGGRIRLRSRRLGKTVVPRLTSAHDFMGSGTLAVYRFLCRLQDQHVCSGLAWDWGALGAAPWLPRVRIGKCVLALARWRITPAENAALRGGGDAAAHFAELQRLRAARDLPRFVNAGDLFFDFDNLLSAEDLVRVLRKRPDRDLILTEVFPSPDHLCVTGAEGAYTHELIVPFVSTRAPRSHARRPRSEVHAVHVPGSDWLYASIYAGRAAVDGLLLTTIAPLMRALAGESLASEWFFIRFGDPDWHLRVRARTHSGAWQACLMRLTEALAPAVQTGVVWKFQLDTYMPELDRYGGAEALELAHAIFAADSAAALELLTAGLDANVRWRLALASIHHLLLDFGFDVHERARLTRTHYENFAAEHRRTDRMKKWLQARFRAAGIQSLIDGGFRELAPVLDARSRVVREAVAGLRELDARGVLTSSIEALASSFTHMAANRLLRSRHRTAELVLNYFLWRAYESQAARQ